MNKLSLMLAAVLAVLMLSGCNTIKGIGKDIERGGEAIQRAVQ